MRKRRLRSPRTTGEGVKSWLFVTRKNSSSVIPGRGLGHGLLSQLREDRAIALVDGSVAGRASVSTRIAAGYE